MKVFTLVIILCWSAQTFAQLTPWNAKVMLHSQNGYIDTLWIGCDSNGNAGYQSGLDILDTSLIQPGGIWGYDPLIPVGECFNLKRNIKNFSTGIQKFDIQVVDSSFSQGSFNFDYISIDTNDFKFNNGAFKITSVFLQCFNGYIISVDLYSIHLYVGYDTSYPAQFLYDSVSLIFEPDLYDCLPINDHQMELRLEVGFNYYINTSVEEAKSSQIVLFPNPAKNIFNIKSGFPLKKLTIFDQLGRIMESKYFEGELTCEINTEAFYSGIYTAVTETQASPSKTFVTKVVISDY